MRISFTRVRMLAGSILAIVLAVAAFVPVAPNTVERSETPTPVSSGALRNVTHGFRPIESLEVGQRVLTGFASDQDRATAVDPTTWKKLTLTATYHWTDGTPDTFHVTTLQSPEWMREQAVAIGAQVPMPLDVQEMGCPDGLLAEVESIEPCPVLQDSPGRVILTTVKHLNSACRTLTVRAPDGTSEEIHTTDYHPFWSETKQGWVKAYTLAIGDQLQGLHGDSLTLVGSQSIPGIHTVYNMTVEAEHVYRVGSSACRVHNNDCGFESVDPRTIRFTQDSVGNTVNTPNGPRPLRKLVKDLVGDRMTASDIPPIRVFEKDGKLYTLDNRRLKAFQVAGRPINMVEATAKEISEESWKITTRNDGITARVRGGGL